MTPANQLSWENFIETVFVRGQQRVHRVSGSPFIELFGDGITDRMGIWLELPPESTIPAELLKMTFITARVVNNEGRALLELAPSHPSLQRQFYHFAVAVAERMTTENRPAVEAVSLELKSFADLLEEKTLLGIERQVGLLGELIFLDRLVLARGVDALQAWIGPLGEPHDFRLGSLEFEVKTTVTARRIHTIHGAEQLIPSIGCSLYLISIMLGPPGTAGGFSLADKVSYLLSRFRPFAPLAEQFSARLEASGFRQADLLHYSRAFALRREIAFVPVDDGFPAITRQGIQRLLGPLASRLEALSYDVNVEGLEQAEHTPAFDAVFPPAGTA